MVNPTSSKDGNCPPKPQRKSCAGRKLLRWSPAEDQLALLAVDKVCIEHGMLIPWDAVAREISDNLTGEAIKQHLVKLRNARIAVGQRVPEKLDKGARRKVSLAEAKKDSDEKTTANVIKNKFGKVGDAKASPLVYIKPSRKPVANLDSGRKTQQATTKVTPAVEENTEKFNPGVVTGKRKRIIKKKVSDDYDAEVATAAIMKKYHGSYRFRAVPVVPHHQKAGVGSRQYAPQPNKRVKTNHGSASSSPGKHENRTSDLSNFDHASESTQSVNDLHIKFEPNTAAVAGVRYHNNDFTASNNSMSGGPHTPGDLTESGHELNNYGDHKVTDSHNVMNDSPLLNDDISRTHSNDLASVMHISPHSMHHLGGHIPFAAIDTAHTGMESTLGIDYSCSPDEEYGNFHANAISNNTNHFSFENTMLYEHGSNLDNKGNVNCSSLVDTHHASHAKSFSSDDMSRFQNDTYSLPGAEHQNHSSLYDYLHDFDSPPHNDHAYLSNNSYDSCFDPTNLDSASMG